jgi:hypothetical protein
MSKFYTVYQTWILLLTPLVPYRRLFRERKQGSRSTFDESKEK